MHYKKNIVLLILTLNISISCLPYLASNESKKIVSINLAKDIHIYSDSDIDIETSKVYNIDGNYYFGNFYYPTKDSIYILDTFNKNIISVGRGREKKIMPVHYENIEESSIVLVDDNSIYLKGSTVVFTENIETVTKTIIGPLTSPEIEYAERNVLTSISEMSTNYKKVDTISLSKLDKNGNFIFKIKNIAIDDENTHITKVIPSINFGFAIFKHTNNDAILSIYDSNGGFDKSVILSEIETLDIETKSYKEIIDITYVPISEVFMALVISIKEGLYDKSIVYSINESTLEIEELYSINKDEIDIPMGITKRGVVVSSSFENDEYFIYKKNTLIREDDSKYAIKTSNNLRNLKTFNDGVYAYEVSNGIVTFYEY